MVKIMQKLRRNIGKAIEDYQMICNKDRVMVCLSGGKDFHIAQIINRATD